MPIHDWTTVSANIFHAFHHGWIDEIATALNGGILPQDHYALPEQRAAGFGPDVLTLQEAPANGAPAEPTTDVGNNGGVLLAPPKVEITAESDMAFYRRKQNTVTVRHSDGDRIIAVVEIVSPGNKNARHALRAFVDKAAELLELGIHLLILDLIPPGPRDPAGIHNEIWQEIDGSEYAAPGDQPLTLAAYEAGTTLRAYVVNIAVGEAMQPMPLFLAPGKAVEAPLEATYSAAFNKLPARWQKVLDGGQ